MRRGILRQAVSGHLDLLLLAALEDGPAHGYAISGEIRTRSRGTIEIAEGTLYPALQRLEDRGLLRSERRLAQGRERRVYALTARGKAELSRRRDAWRTFSLAMTRAAGGN